MVEVRRRHFTCTAHAVQRRIECVLYQTHTVCAFVCPHSTVCVRVAACMRVRHRRRRTRRGQSLAYLHQDFNSNTSAVCRVQDPAVPRGAAGSREHRKAPRRPRGGGGCHGEHQTRTLLPCCGHCPGGGCARDGRQLRVHAAARRMHGRHAFILHLRPAPYPRGGGRQCRGQGRVSPDHAPIPTATPLPIDMFTGMLPRKKRARA